MSGLIISELRRVACMAVYICILGSLVQAQEGKASENAKELQVLSKFIGAWDGKYDNADAPNAGAELTADWILDGKFIQRTIKFSHAKLEILELMTFDSSEKCFRKWEFSSEGRFPGIESKGSWNEETKTMTWIATLSVGTRTTKNTFENDSTLRWEVQGRNLKGDPAGAPVRGVNTMRKKAN